MARLRIYLLVLVSISHLLANSAISQDNQTFCGISYPKNTILCPKVSDLKYNSRTLIWETSSGWQGTQSSTATRIKKFSGAQWNGWATGSIICVYTPEGNDAFPVYMSVAAAVKKPVQADSANDGDAIWANTQWKLLKQDKGSTFQLTMNCPSSNSNICDCPFQLFISKEQSTKEIIESIRRDPFNRGIFSLR